MARIADLFCGKESCAALPRQQARFPQSHQSRNVPFPLAEWELLDWESFAHLVSAPTRTARTRRPVTDARDLGDLPSLEKVERDYIMEVLQATRWNRKRASEILGISTVTLWRKVQGERPES